MRMRSLATVAVLAALVAAASAYTDADLIAAYNTVFTAEDGSFVSSMNLIDYAQGLAKQAAGQSAADGLPLDLSLVRALSDRNLLVLVYEALLGRFTQTGLGSPYPPCAAVIDTETGFLKRREPESHNCTLVNLLLIVAIIGLIYSWKRGVDAKGAGDGKKD